VSDSQFNQTSHGPGSALAGPGGKAESHTYDIHIGPQASEPTRAIHLPQRKANFIGREDELATLARQLTSPGSLSSICGVAGRGKTSLALEYAHRHTEEFDSVHWLPCQERSLAQIAGELAFQLGLKPEGDADALVRELNFYCARKRCLLVLDNVDDETPAPLASTAGRASILVTTRFRSLPFLKERQSLDLPLFTEDQCFELFRAKLGKEEVDRHAAAARAIFKRLEYLPIGISVAAGLLRDDPFQTIEAMAASLPADVYSLLREAVSRLSPAAQTLLAAMAVCAPEGFRRTLAAEIAGLDAQSASAAGRELYALNVVELIDRESQRYRLHAMVRDAAGAGDDLRARHAASVHAIFAPWETNWKACQEEMAEFQTAFQWLVRQSDEAYWLVLNHLVYMAYSLARRVGRLPEAYEICESMAKQAKERRHNEGLQVWYGNQALILQAWGRLAEALDLHKKEEALCLELGNRDGLQASYGNQATILQAWGRLDEALELHKKEEAICIELGNRDGLGRSYGNQALILKAWGRLDEALELHKKQEAVCIELGNRDGLQASYGNQATILQAWGRLDEALELHKKEEAICLELGNRDGLGRSYGNQAGILQARERLDEALELHKKQEAICLELGNRDGLQASYGNQALILKARGRLDEALELHKKEEAICLELGNREGLQASYGNQARILQAWGRLDEALELHKKQEAICLELGNRDGLAFCYGNWGLLARRQGDAKTGREKLERARALFAELKMPRQLAAVEAELEGAHGDELQS
jgi:tetratricopeptide (TPR) repeat protein